MPVNYKGKMKTKWAILISGMLLIAIWGIVIPPQDQQAGSIGQETDIEGGGDPREDSFFVHRSIVDGGAERIQAGQVFIRSGLGNLPVQGLGIQLESSVTEPIIGYSNSEGVLATNFGDWTLVPMDQGTFLIPKKVSVGKDIEKTVHCYFPQKLSVRILNENGVPQSGVTLRWVAGPINDLVRIGESDDQGRVELSVVGCPCRVVLANHLEEEVEYEFPHGIPNAEVLELLFDSKESNGELAWLIDSETKFRIQGGTLTGGKERILSEADGSILIPNRWARDLEYFRVSAPGYQDQIYQIYGELPAELQLVPTIEFDVQLVGPRGAPLPNGTVHIFSENPEASSGNSTAITSYGPVVADVEGVCRVNAVKGRPVRILGFTQGGLYGETQIEGASKDDFKILKLTSCQPLVVRAIDQQDRKVGLNPSQVRIRDLLGGVTIPELSDTNEFIVLIPALYDWMGVQPDNGINVIVKRLLSGSEERLAHDQKAGGELVIEFPQGGDLSGVIEWASGAPASFEEFSLIPVEVPAFGKSGDLVLGETDGWIAIASSIPIRFSTNSHGQFQLSGIPPGRWRVQLPRQAGQWALGQSFETTALVDIPSREGVSIKIDQGHPLHLSVQDGLSNAPIPKFQVRVRTEDGSNIGVRTSWGKNGIWTGQVMESVMGNLEIWADGYEATPIEQINSETKPIGLIKVNLRPIDGIRIVLNGPAAEAALGWPLAIAEIDKGERGIFKIGLWRKEIRLSSLDGTDLSIPSGVRQLQITPLRGQDCSFRFLRTEYSVHPGSIVELDVYPR